MRLCLSCYRLWPREAILCGWCGRSFNGRLCPRRHLSPASARCCVLCGQTPLTEPTASLPLGWLAALLVWSALAGLAVCVWHFISTPLEHEARQGLAWLMTGGVVLALIPGALGRQVRARVSRFLRGLWRLALYGAGYRLLRDTGRWLHSLVEGSRRNRYR